MSDSLILDGTGQGYRAKVDDRNRLRTFSITESAFEEASVRGEAFNINTEFVTVSSTAETPLLRVINNEATDLALVGWFIGTDLGTVGANLGIMRLYGNVSGASGGTEVPVINRRIGDPKDFAIEALKSPTWTPSGTPILYQTQGLGSRVFGTIYLILGKGSSMTVTCEFPTATTPISIYTGFTGYLE